MNLRHVVWTSGLSYETQAECKLIYLEFNVIKSLGSYIDKVKFIFFEHHYDDMIIKGYTFKDIHSYLSNNNFIQIYKIKMPFRKTFEYIYSKKEHKNDYIN